MLIDTMSKNKESFQDVYSLTSYFFDDMFSNIFYFDGDVYIIGGDFELDKPVAYKKLDGVTLFKESFPKDNFVPLIKY